MSDFFNADFITFNISHLIVFAVLLLAVLAYNRMAEKYEIVIPIGARLIIQLIAIGLIIFDLYAHHQLSSWWMALIVSVVGVGIINAYDFIDGIKRMTGLNNLVILCSLQYVNRHVISFIHPDFIIYAILTCVVFFLAGNIGNLVIAFWTVVLLLKLILGTDDIIWILFLAVYGIDMICTIVRRVYLRQNIFNPHQVRNSHLRVSAIYAAIQLIICIVVIAFRKEIPEIMLFSTLIGLLVVLYVLKLQYDLDNVDKDF